MDPNEKIKDKAEIVASVFNEEGKAEIARKLAEIRKAKEGQAEGKAFASFYGEGEAAGIPATEGMEDGKDTGKTPEAEPAGERSAEDLLLEEGRAVADELTSIWNQLLESQKAEDSLAILAGAGGDGRKLFESFIEDMDDEIKQGRKAEEILQEGLNAINSLRETANKYLKEKEEAEAKVELKGEIGSIKAGQTNQESMERIAHAREEVARARKEFAEMENKKKTMWGSVRTFFNRQKIEKKTGEIEGKQGEHAEVLADDDVTYMRALYDNKIFDLKEAIFADIKTKGLEGEDLEEALKKATLEITAMERCAAYDAKTDVKEESMKGTNLEVVKGYWQKSVDWYRNLPKKTQRYITVGLWAGVSAATFGGATGIASGFAVLGIAKRFLAGSSIGMASYAGADKIADKARNWRDGRSAEKISKKYEDLSPEERVEKIKKELTRDVLMVNDQVNRREYWDTFRMTGAAVFGATIGSGVLFHWLSDHFGIGEKAQELTGKAAKSELGQKLMEKFGMPISPDEVNPLTNSLEQTSFPTEASLSVEPGSGKGIEHSLIAYLKEHHAGDVKDPGAKAHLMVRELARNMAEKQGVPFDRVMEQLNHIQSADFKVDGKLSINDFHAKWAGIPVEAQEIADVLEASEALGAPEAPVPAEAPIAENAIPYNPEHDYRKIETEMRVENAIQGFNEDYKAAADDALMHPAGGDGPSVEQYEAMGEADRLRKEAGTLLNEMQTEDVPWRGEKNLAALLEKGAGPKQILSSSMEKITEGSSDKLGYWREIKDKPLWDVIYEDRQAADGKLKKGFAAVVGQFQQVVGAEKLVPIDKDETTAKWLARITRLALNKKAGL